MLRNLKTREVIRMTDDNLMKTKTKSTANTPIKSFHQIDEEIKKNKITFPKQKKFKYNGSEYVDAGQQNGMYKVYNMNKKVTELYKPEEYMNMVINGFDMKVNINGSEY